MRFARRSASFVLLAAFAASCSEGPPRAASLIAHSSVSQSATVASSVTPRPSVQVLDNKGNPFPNFPIEFAVTSGGGTLSRTRDTTDENGIASSGAWQLSTTAGANTVAASGEGLDGSPLIFTVTGTPTAPTQIAAQGGDNQTATVGSAVSVAPAVVVRDQFSNPVPGIPVTFTVSAGGGSTSAATVTTNASGVATLTTWTLGTAAGVNTLAVTADGTPGAVLTATGQPGPVTAIAIQRQPSGAASGSAFARQPIIRLADAFGNQVTTASSTVTASVASGGTISGTTSVASVNGIAAFTDLAITGEGSTTLSFSATGGTSAVTSSAFTVSAPAGAAAQLVVGTQPSGATSAKVFTVQPDVEVRDAAGINATAGAFSVTASLSSPTGTLTGTTTVTTVNGIATFTDLGVIGSGTYTLDFAATSLTGASSASLSVAAPPIQGIEIFGGDKQAAFAGSAVELKP
jgi:adhesin/invasin